MIDKESNKDGQSIIYMIILCKHKGTVDDLNGISYNVTLLQLMDPIGYVNHAVSIFG